MQTNSVRFFFFLSLFPFFSPYVSTTIITLMYCRIQPVQFVVWYDRLPTLHTHTLQHCLRETYNLTLHCLSLSLFLSSSLIFAHDICTYSSIVLILCVHYHAWHTCFQSYLKLMSGCLSLVKLRFAENHALVMFLSNLHRPIGLIVYFTASLHRLYSLKRIEPSNTGVSRFSVIASSR